jgi:hypothetical protein
MSIEMLPHTADSRVSLLGLSNSALQQTRFNQAAMDQAILDLMEPVEPLPLHPQYILKTILWDYEDCFDLTEGIIITESNKCQPQMNLAIHNGDSRPVSQNEFKQIQHVVVAIAKKLIAKLS